MCGRYGLMRYGSTLADRLETEWIGEPSDAPRYNLCPTQYAPVIHITADGPRLEMQRWGLIPAWTKDKPGSPLCNVRSETVATKPSFRTAYKWRRGAAPMSGFIEWQRSEVGGKIPHWIHPDADRELMVASLWEEWTPKDAEPIRSFTILTRGANPFMERLHDRMPLFLDAGGMAAWLKPGPAPDLDDLVRRAADTTLAAYPISPRINSPRNQDASLLDPDGPPLVL